MLVFLHPPSIRTYCFANIRSLTACFLIKWSWEGELVQRECMATRLHIRRDIPSVSAVRKERETKPVVVGITRWSKLMKIFPAKIENYTRNLYYLYFYYYTYIAREILIVLGKFSLGKNWQFFGVGKWLMIAESGGGEVRERSTRRRRRRWSVLVACCSCEKQFKAGRMRSCTAINSRTAAIEIAFTSLAAL